MAAKEFDPEEYLKEKESEDKSKSQEFDPDEYLSGFDPDEYLKEKEIEDDKKSFSEAMAQKRAQSPSVTNTALDVVDTAFEVLDYPAAIGRQVISAPAKAVKGDPYSAIVDILTQPFSRPSTAPSPSQVLESYGVPRQKQVSPIAQTKPLMASTYEMNPMPGDEENVESRPSEELGALVDMLSGPAGGKIAQGAIWATMATGRGVKSAAKGAKDSISSFLSEIAGTKQADLGLSDIEKQMIQSSGLQKKSPTSFDEMSQRLMESGASDIDLPQAPRVREITTKILPNLTFKPTDLHMEMLKSKSKKDEIRALYKTLPSKEKDILDRYDQMMRSELIQKIEAEALWFNPSPRQSKTSGDYVINTIDNIYKDQKSTLTPVMNALRNVDIPKKIHIDELMNKIGTALPDVAKFITQADDGSYQLAKFSPKMGLSKTEYSNFVDVLDSINTGSLDFKEMQSIREFLRKSIDPIKPKETAEISKLRKVFLDHMEDLIQYKKPSLEVRETFREWAKNEKKLETLSELIGGKVGDVPAELKADPTKVLDRVFSSYKNAQILKQENPRLYGELIGDLIYNIIEKSRVDAGVVSTSKLRSNLKKYQEIIKDEDPRMYNRLAGAVDLMRILPDMPDINPSGSAKATLMNVSEDILRRNASGIVDRISDSLAAREAKKSAEKIMSPTGSRPKGKLTQILQGISRPGVQMQKGLAQELAIPGATATMDTLLSPQIPPLTEQDVRMMDISPSEKAKKINDIRSGKEIYR